MSLAEPILQLDGAALPIEPVGGATAPIDLAVAAGEFLLIDLVEPRRAADFADTIMALLPPIAGRVLFEGRDWQEMPQPTAEALRRRIGRAYRDDLWLPFLSVPENILLRPSYHTRSSRFGLLTEASRLCQGLGLPGVPAGFPKRRKRGRSASSRLGMRLRRLAPPRRSRASHRTAWPLDDRPHPLP